MAEVNCVLAHGHVWDLGFLQCPLIVFVELLVKEIEKLQSYADCFRTVPCV